MPAIKYIPEMEMQDQLWLHEQENLPLMNHLQWSIIKAFLRQGNPKGLHFNVYFNDDESIVDVYGPEDIASDGHIIQAKSFGNCKGLVNYLNRVLQQQNHRVKFDYNDFAQYLNQEQLTINRVSEKNLSLVDIYNNPDRFPIKHHGRTIGLTYLTLTDKHGQIVCHGSAQQLINYVKAQLNHEV